MKATQKIVSRGYHVYEYTTHLHFQERSSLLYEHTGKVRSESTAHHSIYRHLQHQWISFSFREPCRCHTEQRARKLSQSNEEGKRLWNEKDEGEENKEGELEKPRHVLVCVCKNRPTRGMFGGLLSPGVWALPFLSFPPSSRTSPSPLSQHEHSERSCGSSRLGC